VWHAKAEPDAAFSPDGARIVTASNGQSVLVWDAQWLVNIRGTELVRSACRETLEPGVQLFGIVALVGRRGADVVIAIANAEKVAPAVCMS
jgi:WD40 repeat protein